MTHRSATALAMNEELFSGHSPVQQRQFLADLIAETLAGDSVAFDQIMLLTQRRVVVLCWRILGDREDARDAAQETFIRVYRHLRSFRLNDDFYAWLYRITINVCHDFNRQRSSRRARLIPLDVEAESGRAELTNSADDLRQSEKRALLEKAISLLTHQERTAFVLREYEGLTTSEVAAVMKSRPATVRVQIWSAKMKMKKYCEKNWRGKM